MNRLLSVCLLSLAVFGCSDDTQPPADKGAVDVKKSGDGKPGDGKPPAEARPGDTGSPSFPEARTPDKGVWKCTPGTANMCDGYKTQYCLSGACTACPANKTDCDRQGDCECAGICDGTKCKTP